jgi:hypothetical protein
VHLLVLPMLPRGTLSRRLAAANFCLRGGSAINKRYISTLDPVRLTSADFIDLSGRKTYTIRAGQKSGRFMYAYSRRAEAVFPGKTQGFLYYSPGPAHAPIAGEVRFRITDSPDPVRFANGRDLLMPDMPVPWSISLMNLLSAKDVHRPLCNIILERDRSVSLELATSIREHKDGLVKRKLRVLHSLGQPFILGVSATEVNIRVASGNRLRNDLRLNLPHDTRGELGKSLRERQYTGASSQSVPQKGATYQWMCRFDQVQPRSHQSQRSSGSHHPCFGDHLAHQAYTGQLRWLASTPGRGRATQDGRG